MSSKLSKSSRAPNGQAINGAPMSIDEMTSTVHEMEAMVAQMKALIDIQKAGDPKSLVLKESVASTPTIEWNTPFEETVFTLLYIFPTFSRGYSYGLFVYILQVITISLTLADIVDLPLHANANPLRIPPMVGLTVTWAQGVALLMALAFQTDLTDAVRKLQNGFCADILDQYPGATKTTWRLSCLAQLLSGLLLLTTIVILTMQAEDVLSIMLNFAALHFMAEIDDYGFKIAKLGFINRTLQKDVLAAADFHVPKRKQQGVRRTRVRLFYATLGCIFASFWIIKGLQFRGAYLPTHLHVEFKGPLWDTRVKQFDGVLKAVFLHNMMNHRQYKAADSSLLLGYCDDEEAWTLTLEEEDPCQGFFAKTPAGTQTFDVTTISDSAWKIVDPKAGELKRFASFSLVARDDEFCESKFFGSSWTAWYKRTRAVWTR